MGYLLIFFAVVIVFALVGYLQGVKVKKEEALIQEHTSEIFSGLKSKYLNSSGELKSKYHKSSSDSHISLDIDMPKNILKVGFDLNDTKNGFYDEGITTYYNGKPFSGIGYETFENKLLEFQEGFGKNVTTAHNYFQTAITDIDATIKKLEKIKASLTTSGRQLDHANNKAKDLSIKKLTRGNPTMKAKFDQLKSKDNDD